jgi:Arc/MetJ-type ribon-helix-helix transcriptional regulator
VLQRFERRLETLVEGAFARAFRSSVQPVEIASALQRETTDRAVIVGQGRTLVPNDFVVELGPTDHDRLDQYADTLGEEFAGVVQEYAAEEHFTFVGPVQVRFEVADDVDTGRFRVRSDVIRGAIPAGTLPTGRAAAQLPTLHMRTGSAEETAYPLSKQTTVIGRGENCDLRLADPGASRRHAEVHRGEAWVTIRDLGSTNGTLVNTKRVEQADLEDGDEITIGETTFTFRAAGARAE